MPMDDRPMRDDHSCFLDLDDTHGRIGVYSIFSSPSVAPCLRVVQSTVEFIAILWTCVFMSMVRYCTMCHDLIGDWLCQFNFSRNMPCVILWLVMSFQMPNFTVYKYYNSSPTLHISKIFSLDIRHVVPRLEVFPRL